MKRKTRKIVIAVALVAVLSVATLFVSSFFSKDYTITLSAEGGVIVSGDGTPASDTINIKGKSVTLPLAEKFGYYFTGWKTTSSTAETEGGYTSAFFPKRSQTLYASYSPIPNEIPITFYSEGEYLRTYNFTPTASLSNVSNGLKSQDLNQAICASGDYVGFKYFRLDQNLGGVNSDIKPYHSKFIGWSFIDNDGTETRLLLDPYSIESGSWYIQRPENGAKTFQDNNYLTPNTRLIDTQSVGFRPGIAGTTLHAIWSYKDVDLIYTNSAEAVGNSDEIFKVTKKYGETDVQVFLFSSQGLNSDQTKIANFNALNSKNLLGFKINFMSSINEQQNTSDIEIKSNIVTSQNATRDELARLNAYFNKIYHVGETIELDPIISKLAFSVLGINTDRLFFYPVFYKSSDQTKFFDENNIPITKQSQNINIDSSGNFLQFKVLAKTLHQFIGYKYFDKDGNERWIKPSITGTILDVFINDINPYLHTTHATVFYAVFEPGKDTLQNDGASVTVVFNKGQARPIYSVSNSSPFASSNEIAQQVTAKCGDTIILPSLSTYYLPGYTFLHWQEPNGATYKAGTSYTISNNFGTNYILKAIYRSSSAKLVFDFDGGSASDSLSRGISAKTGEDMTIPQEIPQKFGYSFIGYALRDSSLRLYMPGDTIKATSQAQTLVAVWTPKEVTVEISLTLENGTKLKLNPPGLGLGGRNYFGDSLPLVNIALDSNYNSYINLYSIDYDLKGFKFEVANRTYALDGVLHLNEAFFDTTSSSSDLTVRGESVGITVRHEVNIYKDIFSPSNSSAEGIANRAVGYGSRILASDGMILSKSVYEGYVPSGYDFLGFIVMPTSRVTSSIHTTVLNYINDENGRLENIPYATLYEFGKNGNPNNSITLTITEATTVYPYLSPKRIDLFFYGADANPYELLLNTSALGAGRYPSELYVGDTREKANLAYYYNLISAVTVGGYTFGGWKITYYDNSIPSLPFEVSPILNTNLDVFSSALDFATTLREGDRYVTRIAVQGRLASESSFFINIKDDGTLTGNQASSLNEFSVYTVEYKEAQDRGYLRLGANQLINRKSLELVDGASTFAYRLSNSGKRILYFTTAVKKENGKWVHDEVNGKKFYIDDKSIMLGASTVEDTSFMASTAIDLYPIYDDQVYTVRVNYSTLSASGTMLQHVVSQDNLDVANRKFVLGGEGVSNESLGLAMYGYYYDNTPGMLNVMTEEAGILKYKMGTEYTIGSSAFPFSLANHEGVIDLYLEILHVSVRIDGLSGAIYNEQNPNGRTYDPVYLGSGTYRSTIMLLVQWPEWHDQNEAKHFVGWKTIARDFIYQGGSYITLSNVASDNSINIFDSAPMYDAVGNPYFVVNLIPEWYADNGRIEFDIRIPTDDDYIITSIDSSCVMYSYNFVNGIATVDITYDTELPIARYLYEFVGAGGYAFDGWYLQVGNERDEARDIRLTVDTARAMLKIDRAFVEGGRLREYNTTNDIKVYAKWVKLEGQFFNLVLENPVVLRDGAGIRESITLVRNENAEVVGGYLQSTDEYLSLASYSDLLEEIKKYDLAYSGFNGTNSLSINDLYGDLIFSVERDNRGLVYGYELTGFLITIGNNDYAEFKKGDLTELTVTLDASGKPNMINIFPILQPCTVIIELTSHDGPTTISGMPQNDTIITEYGKRIDLPLLYSTNYVKENERHAFLDSGFNFSYWYNSKTSEVLWAGTDLSNWLVSPTDIEFSADPNAPYEYRLSLKGYWDPANKIRIYFNVAYTNTDGGFTVAPLLSNSYLGTRYSYAEHYIKPKYDNYIRTGYESYMIPSVESTVEGFLGVAPQDYYAYSNAFTLALAEIGLGDKIPTGWFRESADERGMPDLANQCGTNWGREVAITDTTAIDANINVYLVFA